jgi:L-ascorbate metabolism protein UlaG (beta-lactamase superfamily)
MPAHLELPPRDDPASFDVGSVFFVGTATTLLRFGGFTILTDPNFLHAGEHAHLGYGVTWPRLTDPALEVDELPPLDLCLLSHLHGDHWDAVAAARLPRELPVLTTPDAARALRRRGFARARGLRRWESLTVTRGDAWLRVSAMPARHGPPLVSALLPPVMGSMLEWGRGRDAPLYRVYVSGDTLVHDELRRIPERYPHVDLGIFHLGGARVLGVLVTMDAAQGVEAIRIIEPDMSIPVHHDDYPVFGSSLEDFMREVADDGLAWRVTVLARGELYTFHPRPEEAARAASPRAGPPAPRPAGEPASPRSG